MVAVKILFFSDIHGDLKALDALMKIEADHYICAGDLANWGRKLDECGGPLKVHGERVHVIPGNHETAAQTAQFCEKFGLHDFHGTAFQIGSFHVAGVGYSNPTPFDTPGEYSEEQIAEKLAPFAGLKPMIAVCHCPPYQTMLYRIVNFRHAGSTAVRDFIGREQPEYFFCGHIHEAAGVAERLGETKAMNVGKKGYLLDLNPDLIKIQFPGG
jgi:Icc-related predicted phosphoesterase